MHRIDFYTTNYSLLRPATPFTPRRRFQNIEKTNILILGFSSSEAWMSSEIIDFPIFLESWSRCKKARQSVVGYNLWCKSQFYA